MVDEADFYLGRGEVEEEGAAAFDEVFGGVLVGCDGGLGHFGDSVGGCSECE